MRLVGLTGGIASGKSTISNLFRSNGIPVVDADIIARDAVRKDSTGWENIKKYFGRGILLENGEIDRARLGQIVFSNPAKRRLLNRLLAVPISLGILWEVIKLWVQGNEVIVLDIPLLFEMKMHRLTNPVIVVWVDEATQVERLMARDLGCRTEREARRRIGAQLPLDLKRSMADIVIDNSADLVAEQEFERALKQVMSEPLTWKERMMCRDGLVSIVACTTTGVLIALKHLL